MVVLSAVVGAVVEQVAHNLGVARRCRPVQRRIAHCRGALHPLAAQPRHCLKIAHLRGARELLRRRQHGQLFLFGRHLIGRCHIFFADGKREEKKREEKKTQYFCVPGVCYL